jgi:hypothetical protein
MAKVIGRTAHGRDRGAHGGSQGSVGGVRHGAYEAPHRTAALPRAASLVAAMFIALLPFESNHAAVRCFIRALRPTVVGGSTSSKDSHLMPEPTFLRKTLLSSTDGPICAKNGGARPSAPAQGITQESLGI